MEALGNRSLDWIDDAVVMVDQTQLPSRYVTLRIEAPEEMVAAIQRLSVRGAPALGVAGAMGVVLAVQRYGTSGQKLEQAVSTLRTARPTAVNLARMVERTARLIDQGLPAVRAEALSIRDEEIAASRQMGARGADYLTQRLGAKPLRVMTICNTGGLATVELGTALAVIQTLHTRQLLKEALVMETRPLLQGARLTTWELAKAEAPHRLLVDAAGPFWLASQPVDAVLAGADRVTANGDVANKIGTFSLALGAQYARVPFMVVAPESTIDMNTPTGADITIEERDPAEVTGWRGVETAPAGTPVANPAFDLTPVDLIDSLITDQRVVRFGSGEKLAP